MKLEIHAGSGRRGQEERTDSVCKVLTQSNLEKSSTVYSFLGGKEEC